MAEAIESIKRGAKHAPWVANVAFSALAAVLAGLAYEGVMTIEHNQGVFQTRTSTNANVNKDQSDDIRANSSAIGTLANAQARIEAQQAAAQRTLQAMQNREDKAEKRRQELSVDLSRMDHRLTRVEDAEQHEGHGR